MRNRLLLGSLVAFSALAMSFQAMAQGVPPTLSLQGDLTNAQAGLSTTPSITFRLYTTPTGGTPIWSETQTVPLISQGQNKHFSVILGNTSSLEGIPFDRQYYVGISVNGGAEILPRTQLAISPYAVRSHFADSVLSGIGDGTITTSKLVDGAVTTPKIADGSVTTPKLADGAVTTPKIADGSVTSSKIADSTITNADVSASAAISYSKLNLTNSIANGDLTANSVTTSKVANGTVTTSKLADSAVSGLKLLTYAVTDRHIADGAVTLPKINTTGATSGQVLGYNGTGAAWTNGGANGPAGGDLTGTYPNPTIAASAVTSAKIADSTITNADIGASAGIHYSKLTLTNGIANGDLQANSVTTSKVANGTVTTSKMADSAVSGLKLLTYAVTDRHIADGAVTLPKINPTGATTGQVLGYDGTNVTWTTPVDGTVTHNATLSGNGTSGSPLGINLGNSNTWTANQTFGGTFLITSNSRIAMTNSDNNARDIRLQEPSGTGSQYIGLRAPSVTNNGNYVLPAVVGSVGQVLSLSTSNGVDSATMAWTTPSSGATGAAGGDLSGSYPNPVIAGSAVTSSKIQDSTITNADIGASAGIHYSKLTLTNGIANGDLQANSVTTSKVANGTVTTSKMADSAVSGLKLLTFAVTNRHLADNAVTLDKIDPTGATTGQVITYDGTNLVYATPSGGGLTLPYSQSASAASPLLSLTQTGASNVGSFVISNSGSSASVLNLNSNGIGNGLAIQLSNSSNGGRGIDVTQSGVGPGVFSTSTGGNAVWGVTTSISAAGVIGDNTFGEAIVGRNRGGNGVGAVVGRNDSSGYGVRGFNTKNGYGVLGQAGISGGTGTAGRFENVNAANTSDALQVVTNSSGNAARFTGNVVINGNLTVSGTVAKGGGSFMIDHPLDPKNKILYHSFVESPDMMNINNGVIKLDAKGEATVQLPNWFEALNGDFRYQLTAIGAPAPGLYVAEEVKGNQFKIAGGKPGMKVSWEVTGIRHDAYAQKHRIQVEVEKSAEMRGQYLHPDAYGVETPAVQTLGTAQVNSQSNGTASSNAMTAPARTTGAQR